LNKINKYKTNDHPNEDDDGDNKNAWLTITELTICKIVKDLGKEDLDRYEEVNMKNR